MSFGDLRRFMLKSSARLLRCGHIALHSLLDLCFTAPEEDNRVLMVVWPTHRTLSTHWLVTCLPASLDGRLMKPFSWLARWKCGSSYKNSPTWAPLLTCASLPLLSLSLFVAHSGFWSCMDWCPAPSVCPFVIVCLHAATSKLHFKEWVQRTDPSLNVPPAPESRCVQQLFKLEPDAAS